MLFERLKNVNGGADTNIGFGYFVDDNQSPTIGKPLLFLRKNQSLGLQHTRCLTVMVLEHLQV